jgi:hypothetical protein
MINPHVIEKLAHLHIAELHADAEKVRSSRSTAKRARTPASLWRRRRGRAGPTLVLVGSGPAPSTHYSSDGARAA